MFICSQIDDGQCEGNEGIEQAKTTPRTLVYDVETGSLRYLKSRAAFKSHPKSFNPIPLPSGVKVANDGGKDGQGQHSLLGRFQSEDGSGESSPTCVIQNSALRSNSSSPTMSTVSKASSEAGRRSDDQEGRNRGTRYAGTSPSEYEQASLASSPGPEFQKIGDIRGPKKLGSNTPGRLTLKGPLPRRVGIDPSSAKENGWSLLHEQGSGELKEAQTPLKAIQCATADRTSELKKKHGGIPSGVIRSSPQSASVMNGYPAIFSFNATYMPRAEEAEFNDLEHSGGSTRNSEVNRTGVHRTAVGPLLKPTPSKWDDAEKWLAGSELPVRAKARSGPLLAQMVASQAGMSVSKRGPLVGQIERQSGLPTGAGLPQRSEADDTAEAGARSIATPKLLKQGMDTTPLDFTADEKEQLKLLVDRYSLEDMRSRGAADGKNRSSSPASEGSFLKIAARIEKSLVESLPTAEVFPESPYEVSGVGTRSVSTRDMGTTMTPIESVEPSRTGTPLRATTPEKRPNSVQMTSPEHTRESGKCDKNAADTWRSTEGLESPGVLTEKELQAKTRQEILALGTQLGKTNIAAWATREENPPNTIKTRNKSGLDLEDIRRTVLATRAAAWEEAEKAKYTSRFQQEEAKIQAWENHEMAKAEAEMRRVEVKVERMRSHAHEKLTNKLAAARRQAEELRAAAEARRSEAAAKTVRRAELIKTNGKFPKFLFLSFLCT